MSDHVRELVGKVAEEISSRGGNNSSADGDWVEAEGRVQKYIKLKRWGDPENDIAWHLDNCSLPTNLEWNRRDESWRYLVMDVYQRPLIRSMN